MNKKGFTLIELLISITLTSIIVLLLFKIINSLSRINNDETYASRDIISKNQLIQNIETDFLDLKLNGVDFNSHNIVFKYENASKELVINNSSIVYDNEEYPLISAGATYNLCPTYTYQDLDDNYYLITLTINVLINGENTTVNDDIILSYIGLKEETSNYPKSYNCSK